MKILILSTSDLNGGAARAAFRLHRSLKHEGVDSSMLVQQKMSDDKDIYNPDTKSQKIISLFRSILDKYLSSRYKSRTRTPYSPARLPFGRIADRINRINPDIVHLHWIAGGFLNVRELAKIKAPIIWTLHDMWAFTGGCHYDLECRRFVESCGECRVLGSRTIHDLSRKVWKDKKRTYSKIEKLYINGSSTWLTECAKNSSLLKSRKFVTIGNPIDTNIFRTLESDEIRKTFNIPLNKKVIMFGAMSPTSDSRKGFEHLVKAVNTINLPDVIIVIAGTSHGNKSLFNMPVYYIPPVNDEYSLALIYNAADVFVVPSIQENLSNSILESMSCGVPVVAFDIGGNKDLIDHEVTGYLARPFLHEDLAEGITWVLTTNDYTKIRTDCQNKVNQEYSYSSMASKYINLYKSVLS